MKLRILPAFLPNANLSKKPLFHAVQRRSQAPWNVFRTCTFVAVSPQEALLHCRVALSRIPQGKPKCPESPELDDHRGSLSLSFLMLYMTRYCVESAGVHWLHTLLTRG